MESGSRRLRPLPPALRGYEKYVQPDGNENEIVARRFKLLKRIEEDGFRIGSHSFYHRIHNYIVTDPTLQGELDTDAKKRVLYFKSTEEMENNIKKGEEVIRNDLKGPIRFIRLPFGGGTLSRSKKHDRHLNNAAVINAYRSLGFRHIGWDIDSKDYYYTKLIDDPGMGEELEPEGKV